MQEKMEKILIIYNSVIHSKRTDSQISIILGKTEQLFWGRDYGIDMVLPSIFFDKIVGAGVYTERVENIYTIEFRDADSVDYRTYAEAICQFVKKNRYAYIFIPSGLCSKPISASLSACLEAGVTVDVLDMYLEDNRLTYIRTTAARETLAYIQCYSKIQIATLKLSKGNVSLKLGGEKKFAIHRLWGYKTRCLYTKCRYNQIIRDECNDIVIGVGKGVSLEVLERIKRFAQKHNLKIMASKPCIEAGMFEVDRQIGQSGCEIKAKLYIAVGISGAMQHMVGVLDCKNIISINPDQQALINDYANVSVLLNAEEVF